MPDQELQKLTPRERQIARLVANGYGNELIASSLCLQEGTIKQYLYVLFQKLGIHNRTELALWYLEHDKAAGSKGREKPEGGES